MTSAARAQHDTHSKDWHARFAAARARLQLHYCHLFKFWRACRDKRCRRHRRCCGDTSECLKRRLGEITRHAQFQARQAILEATAKNADAAEREVQQLMPYDVITPDPLQEAMARFKSQMRDRRSGAAQKSSPVITGEVRHANGSGPKWPTR
jgi:hypothetical protein